MVTRRANSLQEKYNSDNAIYVHLNSHQHAYLHVVTAGVQAWEQMRSCASYLSAQARRQQTEWEGALFD